MLPSLQSSALHFLDWNLERIARCLDRLTPEQIWQRPNASSNSVGNQLLHLTGNIRQWILTGLGGQPDVRERDAEFAASGGVPAEVLLSELAEVIQASRDVIGALTEEELLRERPVQAYTHDGVFIVLHVVEHLSYHTGQIIFWTKALQDIDLDLYGDVDLTRTT